jgi:AraC family transcriptional regulator
MKRTRQDAYAARFTRVLDFIDAHLDEPLTTDALSGLAHFSKFHFHRQFCSYVGTTPSRYVQLARLRRASYRLAFNPLERITDIAAHAGFERPESFSRAFKDVFGQAPSAFREKPDWSSWSAQFQWISRKETATMQVKIIEVEPVSVAVFEHRGDPALLNGSVQRFITWRKASGLSPIASSQTYGIAYDDPQSTPAERFRFDICGSVSAAVPANEHGVITKTIPGGRCAAVRHRGSPDHIAAAVYHLYRNWLPRSGEELRDFPIFFHYLNLRTDTPEHELLTDVLLPIQ